MLSQSLAHGAGSSVASSRQPAARPSYLHGRAGVRHHPATQPSPENELRTACRASASSAKKGFADTRQASKSGAAKSPKTDMKCPCGSKRPYKDCCGPYHQGAWARSAVDLAMARFSAASMGLAQYLVDTTHPDSLLMMGSSRRLLREMETKCKQSQQCRFRLTDMCAGVSRGGEHEDRGGDDQEGNAAWLLVLVIDCVFPEEQYGVYSGPQQILNIERYVKHGGQWMYWKEENSVPNSEPFMTFMEKHSRHFRSDEEEPGSSSSSQGAADPRETCSQTWRAKAGKQSDGSDWPFSFELVSPCYAPQGATEDEVLGPWLWDAFAAADGQPPAPLPGQTYPRRRQLVYLDDYAPSSSPKSEASSLNPEQQQLLLTMTGEDLSDDEGLSVRRAALLNHRLRQQLSKLRNPEVNRKDWEFRTGKYQ